MSNLSWHLLHKWSPSLNLGDLLSPVKSLEGEQSAFLAFYAGVQNAHVAHIWRPREKTIIDQFFLDGHDAKEGDDSQTDTKGLMKNMLSKYQSTAVVFNP